MSSSPLLETVPTHRLQARAMRVHAFGGPEAMKLELVDLPDPAPGEILVEVRAAGVGPWDAWVRSGKSVLPQPLPLTPGSDVSGIVERIGPGVVDFRIGEEVYGTTNAQFTNGYATRALCTAAMMAAKPESLSFIEAAGVPVVAVTASQMLFDHAQVKVGETVLILGASGSVGSFAVQLAHAAGLRVIASARGDARAALTALGADTVIGALSEPHVTRPGPVDAVIDLVGGETQRLAMSWLRPGGRLISAVSEPDPDAAVKARISARFILVDVTTAALTRLAAKFDGGALTMMIGTVLHLDEAIAAHEMIEGRLWHAPGKIVLAVD